MATILEFPNRVVDPQVRAEPIENLAFETPPSPNVKRSFFEHIDEIFRDYRSQKATLGEVSGHIKAIVGELVDQANKGSSYTRC